MFRTRLGWFIRGVTLAVAVTLVGSARANVLDPNFTEIVWSAAGSGGATGFAWAPDGSNRLFVAIKEGAVRIIENGTLLPTAFATESVHTNSECGVIGIAFDPNFVENHYVYVFATVSSSEQQIIRYTANGNVASERTVIVRNLPTVGNNHDGGAVGFGPDGKLYWAIGDLGNGTGVDTDLGSLAAKIGRANRDGTAPNDNPFFDGQGGPNNDWIWARGFRNPFTFTFQPATGLLWVNSVGTSWEQVFVVTAGAHAGYNDYENNQPNGFLAPVVAYRTNAVVSSGIVASTGAVRSGGVVTFTTMDSLGLRRGTKVNVSGVSDTSFNGDHFVVSVPSATTFTVAQAESDATSGGGTAAVRDIGNSITGGTFLDTSAVPAAYRGNFFFADYGTSVVERVTLANDNSVTSVDEWATNIPAAIDVEVGPDGALYMLAIDGTIFRASYNANAQGIVVTPLHVRMDEAGRAAVMVRLATAPASDVVVSAAFGGGSDPSLSVVSGTALTFTAANWSTPQPLQLEAARDADASEDTGMLALTSTGLTTENVVVRATDEGELALVLSANMLRVTEGASSTFTVALGNPPISPLAVTAARASGSDSVTVTEGTQLTFTPANWSQPQTVRIAAAQDGDNEDTSAQLRLTAAGLAERTVEVAVEDDDAAAPAFTSTPRTAAVAGAAYVYDAEATGRPAATFSLTARPEGMTIDAASGRIEWTPEETGRFAVAIRAANGVQPAATQSFEVEVSEDRPPTCTLTRPTAGERLSGTRAEFYGDVADDVRAVRAVFRVDGEDLYTDTNDDGHYHSGGAHNAFDTTRYRNGRHRVSLVGYDNQAQSCTASVEVTIANDDADDAGIAADAGDGGGDAGPAVDRSDDCSCRIAVQGRVQPERFALAALVLFAVVLRRRARRRSAQAGTRRQ